MSKTILNYHDRLGQVQTVMKIGYDNDVTDCTNVFYTENKIELSWLIGSGLVFYENETEQQHDRSYRSSLRLNQN